jgi:Response regulator of the LytR/AlgR family
MNIAICDDLPQFTRELRSKVEDICAKRDWPLDCLIFTSSKSILSANLGGTQVVFLDIDMPDLNGLEVAKTLRSKYPNIVLVFVTAFIEYAPVGYCVSAFRYLLKQKLDSDLLMVMDDIWEKLRSSSEMLTIRQKNGMREIPLNDILYLEGTPNRMVLLHIKNFSQPVEAIGKLADYESALAKKGFLRLQKSFIANMSHINKISSYQVTLCDGTVIKASEKYYRRVHDGFLLWKGQHL